MAGRPKRRARLATEAAAAGKPLPEKRDHRTELTEKLIAQMDAGTAPWQRTWGDGRGGGRPFNPLSADPKTASGERGYSGINRIMLMVNGMAYGDDRWCTMKQAQAHDLILREGEATGGTTIEVWKSYTPKGKDEPKTETENEHEDLRDRSRMGVRFYTVYNAQQFENFPALERAPGIEWTPIERAENLFEASGAKILHSDSEKTPHYSPGFDHVVMPSKDRFESAEAYYDVATHELVHWTGSSKRLDRLSEITQFGTEAYAREELIAEIGSMFMSAETGIPHNVERHASYVANWKTILTDDKNAVACAAAAASKAVDYVLERERKRNRERDQTLEREAGEKKEHIVTLPSLEFQTGLHVKTSEGAVIMPNHVPEIIMNGDTVKVSRAAEFLMLINANERHERDGLNEHDSPENLGHEDTHELGGRTR